LTELERGASRVAARATDLGYDKYAERAGAILRRAGQPKEATPGGGRSGPSASPRGAGSPGSVR
jgi:hypothetical protein